MQIIEMEPELCQVVRTDVAFEANRIVSKASRS